jgi:hypothetical protein
LGLQYRFGDAAIGSATAEIAAHAFTHALGVVTSLSFLNEAHCAHDLAWCAEATLEGVVSDEGRLHWMEHIVLGQPFDRQQFRAILADCQDQAGIDPTSIKQDGARTALTSVAPFLGAGQIQAFAQQV